MGTGLGLGLGIPFRRMGGGTSFQGLLDLYPNAAAAYSLRKLRAAYAGAAVRIRRSGDNSEFNFGFDVNGDFDIAAAQAFCVAGGGGQNGFITTWYDQSGNSVNISQTTASSQPQIISSGVLLSVSSRGYLNFNADSLSVILSAALNQPLTIFIIGKNEPAGATVGSIFSSSTGTTNNIEIGTRDDIDRTVIFNNTIASVNALSINPASQTSYYALINGASSAIDVNGTTGTGTVTATAERIVLGTGPNWGNLVGYVQEAIFYNSNQSANKSNILTEQRTYYNF
jgi:hypothetical protein